jgi:hypothetical protein
MSFDMNPAETALNRFHFHETNESTSTLSSAFALSNPLHWLLYFSSIGPLICGGVGPAVTLLALSGCVDKWKFITLPDGSVVKEEDPSWVIATTVSALLIGFIANVVLAVRLLGMGNPNHAQYWSITLWITQGA